MAIVEKASTPQQRTISGTIDTIAVIAEREKAKAPAVVVVGEVVNVLRPEEGLEAGVDQYLGEGVADADAAVKADVWAQPQVRSLLMVFAAPIAARRPQRLILPTALLCCLSTGDCGRTQGGSDRRCKPAAVRHCVGGSLAPLVR